MTVAAGAVGSVSASCTSDERASGGGTWWSLNGGTGAGLTTIGLIPSTDSYGVTGYTARGENTTGVAHTFTVAAVCYHR